MEGMRDLDAARTAAVLPFAALVETLERVLPDYLAGRILCPERQVTQAPVEGGVLLSMPCVGPDLMCHKLLTVYPDNPAAGRPAIQGQVTCIDGATGRVLFAMDGPTATGRRTAAVTLVGIRHLLPQAPRRALIYGTGAQADAHVLALAETWPGIGLVIQGRSAGREQAVGERTGIAVEAASSGAACDDADVVILATTARAPLYDQPARAGRLVVGVGAFRPDMVEIGPVTIGGSALYVDDPAGAPSEAGDFIQAGVDWERVHPLAEILTGHAPPLDRPILFKSVGCAAWDLAACQVARQVMARGTMAV